MYALGALIVIGFFLVLLVVFRTEMPEKNKDIGLLVVGALVAKFSDVVSYFFGSSKGSADKTEIINNQKNEI
jgi:CDP-diglyceride synthetase